MMHVSRDDDTNLPMVVAFVASPRGGDHHDVVGVPLEKKRCLVENVIPGGLSGKDTMVAGIVGLGQKIYIVGTGKAYDETKIYNTLTNKWSIGPKLPPSPEKRRRRSLSIVVAVGDNVIAFPYTQRVIKEMRFGKAEYEEKPKGLILFKPLLFNTLEGTGMGWVELDGVDASKLPEKADRWSRLEQCTWYRIDTYFVLNTSTSTTIFLNIEGVCGLSLRLSGRNGKWKWTVFDNEFPFAPAGSTQVCYVEEHNLFLGFPKKNCQSESELCYYKFHGSEGGFQEVCRFALDHIFPPLELQLGGYDDNYDRLPRCLVPVNKNTVAVAQGLKVGRSFFLEIDLIKLHPSGQDDAASTPLTTKEHKRRAFTLCRCTTHNNNRFVEEEEDYSKKFGRVELVSQALFNLGRRHLCSWLKT